MNIPLLAMVKVPSLSIDLVDITFDMEVKSSETQSEIDDKKASWKQRWVCRSVLSV